jgi:chondroitin 4-sulfotransferase 11
MLLSHDKKFLFVAVHKTGSTSIRRLLNKYTDVNASSQSKSPYFFHATASSLQSEFAMNQWDWSSYFKFAFVRNPWERLVSAYFYRQKMVKKWKETPPKNDFYNNVHEAFSHELGTTKNFKDWVKKFLVNGKHEIVMHQHKYLVDENKKLLMDFVGKLENINQDFDKIINKLNVDVKPLENKNKSNHRKYSTYYDEYTQMLVHDYYSVDINLFEYEFNEK